MTYAEALAVLRRYKFVATGNTLDIFGNNEFESGVPRVGPHLRLDGDPGDGAWLCWPGEGDLPQAIAMVLEAEIKRDDNLNALAKLWRLHCYDAGSEAACAVELCASALERHIKGKG